MTSVLAKTPDGTITLTITLPLQDIAKAKEEVIKHAVEETELPGFRKGKAPQNLVEEKLDPVQIQEEILRILLPKAYTQAVEEHKLRPVMSPKIHVNKFEDGKDWEFSATTCEMPEVVLGKYKEAVKDVTAKSKIVIPGKEQKEASFEDIVKALIATTTVTIPHVLVESEVDRLLAQMLDEVKSLGISLEQYLTSTHKTVEGVKKEYEDRAKNDIIIEFILQKIAEEEHILVEPKEIEEAILKAKDEAEKANLEKNRYLLASILRQQKTFDFLKAL